jgi:hypothetical protein
MKVSSPCGSDEMNACKYVILACKDEERSTSTILINIGEYIESEGYEIRLEVVIIGKH